jgi:hypothetical protein
MIIKFKDDKSFDTAHTLLHSHSNTFVYDLYKEERAMKFFTPYYLEISTEKLAQNKINSGEHFDVLSEEQW